jgi:uncharacterized membrane protein
MMIETALIIIFLIVGIVEIILGLPLLYGKVKTNWIYGFRVKKTLEDKEIWLKANKYSGRDITIAGMIAIIFSLFLMISKDSFDINTIGFLGGFVLYSSVIIVLVRGLLYIKKL